MISNGMSTRLTFLHLLTIILSKKVFILEVKITKIDPSPPIEKEKIFNVFFYPPVQAMGCQFIFIILKED